MKSVWKSKTLWVNLVAVAGILFQANTGFVVSPDIQVEILAVVNVILRFVTNEPVSWTKGKTK